MKKLILIGVGFVTAIVLLFGLLLLAVFGVGNTSSPDPGSNESVVAAALEMASHLYLVPPATLDTWYSDMPQTVLDYWQQTCPGCTSWQDGSLQCGMFVAGAFHLGGVDLPVGADTAIEYWGLYAHQKGWTEIPSGSGPPAPGDIMILSSPYFGGEGHMAIVTAVQLPTNGHAGSITIAQANGPGATSTFSLPANLVVSTWTNYTTVGYIRSLTVKATAGSKVTRINQLDPAQYNSESDWSTWAYSACSTASMAEVMNAYGRHYRVADVLKVEAARGDITPALGLVTPAGIADTAQQFGFTDQVYAPGQISLSQVIAIANSGRPVIVGWPPDRYDGGHLLVVVGGNQSTVLLVDSSAYNRQSLSWTQFLQWWGGRADVLSPA